MKSIHTLLAEAHDALRKDPAKMKQYRELVPITVGTSIEVQLNCANAILAGKISEARQTVKNLGRTTELRESAEPLTETVKPAKEKRVKHLVESGRFTEAQAKAFVNQSVRREGDHGQETAIGITTPSGLSEREAKDYRFYRGSGISEAESFAMAKVPNPIIENGNSLKGL